MQAADHIAMSEANKTTLSEQDNSDYRDGLRYSDGSDDAIASVASTEDLDSWGEDAPEGPFDADTLQALEWSKITEYLRFLSRWLPSRFQASHSTIFWLFSPSGRSNLST